MSLSCDHDWSKLHDYILGEIIEKLVLVDYIRFAAVCKSWRLVSLENPSKKHLLLPCLLFAGKTCYIYSFLNQQVSHFPLYFPHALTYYGSSFGWLITLHWTHKMYEVQLINPFLSINKTINLPALPSDLLRGDYRRIQNFVLSANPANAKSGYEIMGILGRRSLVYFKPGRRAWSLIEWKEALGEGIRNVIFFKKTNQFCAVDGSGAVVAINLKPIPTLVHVAPSNSNHGWLNTYIIVESAFEDLLQVHKPNFSCRERCEFYVDMLDQVTGEWIPMFSLGDQMMFLGLHYSSCLSASEYRVCKSNCIYFMDYTSALDKSPKVRVFNFEERTEAQSDFKSEMFGRVPIWIQPTIQGLV